MSDIKQDQEMSLGDLIHLIWQAKISILIFTIIFSTLALAFVLIVTPKYKAEMIVAPAEGYALGDYASKIQYDSIASLPFWRPKDPEGASTDFYRFIYTMRGTNASQILMKDDSLMVGINAYTDPKIKTAEELSIYLSRHVKVDPLGATPLRRLHYSHPDPEFAAALLRKIHLVADQMIRRDRRRQSQSRIEYLQNALNKTLNPDHRKGITNLLMQQEHVQMLANLDEAYAAIIVEPASASPKPTWPNKPLVFGVFIILGATLGFLVHSFRKQDSQA
jgi:hypothetical protein